MAFRRKFRRFRRRRLRPETYTVVQCRGCINVYQSMTCTSPLVDAFELMNMQTPRSASDTTEVSNPSDRAVVVDGIKFQLEYSEDPGEVQSTVGADPNPLALNFMLSVWEAIVLLPLAQGTSRVPSYLPILTSTNFQAGDLADRVLWKRISMVPIFSVNLVTPLQQLEHTIRDMGHGPIAVKARCRIDDRHGLFYVRNFVHDVVIAGVPDQPCDLSGVVNVIPVFTDGWFKIFYHTSK